MVVRTVTTGHLGGSSGSDTLTGIAQNGFGQIHVYAQAGDDTIHLDFSNITGFSHGHHARGDGGNGADDTSTDRGSDIFNFRNIHKVDDIVVGRIEDFDSSRDTLSINGSPISLSQLQSGSGMTGGYSWRVVEYDADSRDSEGDMQQWLLIDTNQGYIFYALEGARVISDDGVSNLYEQESHFVGARGGHQVTAAELEGLATVGYVDPQNYVPAGYTAQGGITINDDDNIYADTLAQITGTGSGDLIAAGLNNDNVQAGGGNDLVWGGSGNDTINGDDGNDTIWGGTGNDDVVGGAGHDWLYGENGNDVLNGWGGNDLLYGGDGNDRLYGQQGNDTLNGGVGHDRLFGSTGNDSLLGGDGDDVINGGQGSDVVVGGMGADTFEFKSDDLVDWDELSGSAADKNSQLDLIADFTIGLDVIHFNGYASVNSMADLKAWKTTIDGNVHFTVQVRATNERVLVDVDESTTWSQFFDSDNFLIG
ncbi:calcium-binding protein [Ponticoccus litoralis]|uniref:Hemolysin type calcium-binding protein n=1 Tax=Ponticoccus litoralis TaxID=422297 RepID=A0AAW9SQC2_9RHOB